VAEQPAEQPADLTAVTVANLPDLAAVRKWVNVPASYLPDEDLGRMFSAAVGVVAEACRVPRGETGDPAPTGWPPALVEAVLRRVQRSIAARNLPLGYIDQASEYGPAKIPAYDVLIEELEGRYRRVVFG